MRRSLICSISVVCRCTLSEAIQTQPEKHLQASVQFKARLSEIQTPDIHPTFQSHMDEVIGDSHCAIAG